MKLDLKDFLNNKKYWLYGALGFIFLIISSIIALVFMYFSKEICISRANTKPTITHNLQMVNDYESKDNSNNESKIQAHEIYFHDLGTNMITIAVFVITFNGVFFSMVNIFMFVIMLRAFEKVEEYRASITKIIEDFEPKLSEIKNKIELARFSDEKVLGELSNQINIKVEEVNDSKLPNSIKEYNKLWLKNFYFWSEFLWATSAIQSIDESIRLKAIYTLGSLVKKTKFAKEILENIYYSDIFKKGTKEWYALKYAKGK
jgi:hypothetical protein